MSGPGGSARLLSSSLPPPPAGAGVCEICHGPAGHPYPRCWSCEVVRRRLRLDVPDQQRILEAAAIKARHPVAYADAFAVATSIAYDAALMTGDPEILERGDPAWRVVDLR